MKKALFCGIAALVLAAAPASAAEWRGTISDAACAAKHSADEHGGKTTSHRDCVEKCIDKGGKYVFISQKDKKVYQIANQDFAGLKTHAAHEVVLTGEMKGDAITVSKIDMPKAEKPKAE
jgi:hypothetical protein